MGYTCPTKWDTVGIHVREALRREGRAVGKVQKSYRLPAETVDAIHARALEDGTSDAEALAAVVAEWDTLRDTVGIQTGIHVDERSAGELEAVREALADARATVEDLRARLDAATEQGAALARIAEHAQALHAVEARARAERPGLLARVRALIAGGPAKR